MGGRTNRRAAELQHIGAIGAARHHPAQARERQAEPLPSRRELCKGTSVGRAAEA